MKNIDNMIFNAMDTINCISQKGMRGKIGSKINQDIYIVVRGPVWDTVWNNAGDNVFPNLELNIKNKIKQL